MSSTPPANAPSPSPAPTPPALTRWVEAALGALAGRAFAAPWVTLALALVLTLASVWMARQLSIDTDLTSLLPRSFQSVQDLDRLKTRFGGMGSVVVLARGSDPDALKRLADDLAPKLEALPEIRYVDHKRPDAFFKDRALLYVDVKDLETIHTRLDKRVTWEHKRNNPFFVDLGDDPKPELDFSDIEAAYRDKLPGGASSDGLLSAPGDKDNDAQEASPYYTDPSGQTLVLFVKPAKLASDVAYTRAVVSDVRAIVDQVDRAAYPGLSALEMTGRYTKRLDQQARIQADLRTSLLVALVLVLVVLIAQFRSLVSVGLVTTPLLMALVWCFGAAELLFGQLNILTAFIGSILMGLGIDHGIHLLSRYHHERARMQAAQAIAETFGNTGRAVMIAALTTTAAFVAVASSEFRAFREFGTLAAVGMVLMVLGYTVVLPALLGLRERWRARSASNDASGASTSAAPDASEPVAAHHPAWMHRVAPWAPGVFWAFATVAAFITFQASDLRFNYDFAALEDSEMPSFKLDKEVNALLGRSQTPLIVLTDSFAHEQSAAQALRDRQAALGDQTRVDFVLSLSDLVPPDQAARKEVLDRIAKNLKRVKPSRLTPEDRARFERFRLLASAEPFDRDGLPEAARRPFQGVQAAGGAGGEQGAVLVFPAVSLSDGDAILGLAEEVRGVTLDDGTTLSAAGEAMVLSDILAMIFRESPWVVGVALGLILVTLWLLLGQLRVALLCLIPVTATLGASLGVAALLDLQLNYLNIIVVPILLGVAVDGGVHLTTRLLHPGDDPIDTARELSGAISGALLTTAMGFGALILADHPGLASLGQLALVGLVANLIACLVGHMALLFAIHRNRAPGLAAGVRLGRVTSTVGFAGFTPKMPGTIGALAALPFGALLAPLDLPVRLGVAAVAVLVSIGLAHLYLDGDNARDPQEIVSDEFVGCLLALSMIEWSLVWGLAAFGLFRLLDIAKPGPIRTVDQRLHGATGVILDDVAAGLVAGLVLVAAQALLG